MSCQDSKQKPPAERQLWSMADTRRRTSPAQRAQALSLDSSDVQSDVWRSPLRRDVLGFAITRPDGSIDKFEATHYNVADDGMLAIWIEKSEVARLQPGTWLEVRDLGTRLTNSWPPDNLELLISEIYYVLCVGYGYDHPRQLGPLSTYEPGLMNELQMLTQTAMEQVGLDAEASEDREIAHKVRDVICRKFGLEARPRRR